MDWIPIRAILCATVLLLTRCTCIAGETDQYLAWEADIEDCSGILDTYFNEQLRVYIDRVNSEYPRVDSGQEFAKGFFFYLFNGLHESKFKRWIKNAEEIDTYPERGVSNFAHQRMSIYRGLTFPFILPMSRTVNVNGIHLGIDKLMHMIGFGRRYYMNYLDYVAEGLDEEAAMEKMILRGWTLERITVGGLVDGIVSYADLEANFQGFRLARDLCTGDAPHVVRRDGQWVQVRDIAIREYVTPEFDESYYPSKYQGLRRRLVNAVIAEKYDLENPPPAAVARFRRYDAMADSFSAEVLAGIIKERAAPPREQHAQAASPRDSAENVNR